MEGTGRWPDNEEAMEKMRAALGCEIAMALETQHGLRARATEGHVDVYVDGFVLRLRMWTSRDDALAVRAMRVRAACFQAWGTVQALPGRVVTLVTVSESIVLQGIHLAVTNHIVQWCPRCSC
jgi:Nrap protein nucleotidyltransferase domain 4